MPEEEYDYDLMSEKIHSDNEIAIRIQQKISFLLKHLPKEVSDTVDFKSRVEPLPYHKLVLTHPHQKEDRDFLKLSRLLKEKDEFCQVMKSDTEQFFHNIMDNEKLIQNDLAMSRIPDGLIEYYDRCVSDKSYAEMDDFDKIVFDVIGNSDRLGDDAKSQAQYHMRLKMEGREPKD